MVIPALVSVLEQFPTVRFETFGTIAIPDELRRFGSRVAAHKPRNNYGEFLQALCDLHWEVGIAPLADTTFNRCRSPIKFLEYTASGVPTVASDMSVYRPVMESGAGLLVQDHGWVDALQQVVTDAHLRRRWLDRARRVCEERFSVSAAATGLMTALEITLPNPGSKPCSGIS